MAGCYYLQAAIAGRRHKIQLQLADILDLLTVSVEAGLGFDAALAKVTEKLQSTLHLFDLIVGTEEEFHIAGGGAGGGDAAAGADASGPAGAEAARAVCT